MILIPELFAGPIKALALVYTNGLFPGYIPNYFFGQLLIALVTDLTTISDISNCIFCNDVFLMHQIN